jgi:ATP-dependent Clp protease ATP-binding subunit ClpA
LNPDTLVAVFERFTDRARRVLVLAQEEARLLNHSFIGTEHLLLGLIQEGEGVAATALKSLGISLEGARERVERTMGVLGSSPSGSPPFTPRAKKVLELSLREALQLGHSYIGTEHILLGLIREGEGVAATVLVDLGADLGRVRQAVMQVMSGDPVSSDVAFPESASSEPRCPQCRTALSEAAVFRSLAIASEVDASEESILLDVVYCVHCGRSLHMFPSGEGGTGA